MHQEPCIRNYITGVYQEAVVCGGRRPPLLRVRLAAHVSNRCKSGIRPVVGRI